MRGIVLAILLTLAGSQKSPQTTRLTQIKPHFAPDKIYRYDYKALINNTLEGEDTALSEFKLTATVEISSQDQSRNFIKILNPVVEEAVGFEPINFVTAPKQTEEIAKCFVQPFKFEYNEGIVGDIFAPQGVSKFCVNLVRGILNMVQVTLRSSNMYELQENGIGGECQTRYVVQDDKKNNGLLITRIKDLNNCRKKIAQSVGMTYIDILPNCPLKEKMVKGAATFVINLKYENSNALINRVQTEQLYEVSPFHEREGSGLMKARQELILKDVKSGAIPIPVGNWQNQGNLHYDFPKDSPTLVPIKPGNMKQKVDELLRGFDASSIKERPETYLQLTQLCRRLEASELNDLYQHYANNRYARSALMIALAYSGTIDTLKVVKDLLHRTEALTELERHWIVLSVFHYAMPDDRLLPVAKEILALVKPHKSTMFKVFGYLGYGSMVRRVCIKSPRCPVSALEPLHELLNEGSNKHEEDSIILALKAIGNAGQPASLALIKNLMHQFPEHIQVVAVWSVAQIGKLNPTKAQDYLMQLMIDHSHTVRVRVMACIAIFQTKPTLPMVSAIAYLVRREKSLQLGSVAYSQMKAMANIRLPHLVNVSLACNVALKLMKPELDQLSYRYSKVSQYSSYSSRYGFGASWNLNYVTTPNQYFSDVIMYTDASLPGGSIQPFEFGVQMEGVSELLSKQEDESDQRQEEDTETRGQETRGSHREKGWSTEDPQAILFFKLFGQEIAFYKVAIKEMQKTWKDPTSIKQSDWMKLLSRSSLSHEMTNGVVMEMKYIVPTTVGLPFEASMNGIVVAHGSIQGNVRPIPSSEKTKSSDLTNMQITANTDIALHSKSITLWGVNTDVLQYMVEMKAHFYIHAEPKFTATLDLEKMNLKFKADPIHQQYELLKLGHEAHVVARDPYSEKKSPVLPPQPGVDIEDATFKPAGRPSHKEPLTQSRELESKPSKYEMKKDECRYSMDSKIDGCEPFPIRIPGTCMDLCIQTTKKTKDIVSLPEFAHFMGTNHEQIGILRPGCKGTSVNEIKGEVSMWPLQQHRMRRDLGQFEDDMEDDQQAEEDQQAQEDQRGDEEDTTMRKKGIKKGYKDDAERQKKKAARTRSEEPRTISSSSSSSSSSRLAFAAKKQMKQRGESTSSASSSGDSEDSSSSSKSSQKDSGSSSSDSTSSDSTSSSESKTTSRHRSRHTSKDRSTRRKDTSSSDRSSSSNSDHSSSSSSSSDRSSSSSSSSGSSSSSSDRSSSSSGSRSDRSSSSDSSSSASDEMSRKKGTPREIYEYRFIAFKGKKGPGQQKGGRRDVTSSSESSSASSSKSRSSSEEGQTNYQPKKLPQVLFASLGAFSNDKPVDAYETTLYREYQELQVLVKDIAEPRKPPVICFNGEIGDHNIWASLKGGRDCRQYEASAMIRPGTFANLPALQLLVSFPRLPPCVESIGMYISKLVPGMAFTMGFWHKEQKNPNRRFELITALEDSRKCIVVMREPGDVYYATDIILPWSVPMYPPVRVSEVLDAPALLLANMNGVCSVTDETITTFNGVQLKNVLPPNCYQILIKVCERKDFELLVMMKHQLDNPKYKEVRIRINTRTIDFKIQDEALTAEDNYVECQNFPHTVVDERGTNLSIVIDKENDKLILRAPKYGLERLVYGLDEFQITVLPWLAGKLCGLCGKFDAETEQEFRTPTGYIAKDAVSFAQSWVEISEDCKMEHTTVELFKMGHGGKQKKCKPDMPVMRCKNGCRPTATKNVLVFGKCPSDDSEPTTYDNEEEFPDVETHLACSC